MPRKRKARPGLGISIRASGAPDEVWTVTISERKVDGVQQLHSLTVEPGSFVVVELAVNGKPVDRHPYLRRRHDGIIEIASIGPLRLEL